MRKETEGIPLSLARSTVGVGRLGRQIAVARTRALLLPRRHDRSERLCLGILRTLDDRARKKRLHPSRRPLQGKTIRTRAGHGGKH